MILTIIVSIILICIILLLIYILLSKHKSTKKRDRQVVIFKTHTWNNDIENFVLKILDSTTKNNIDFFVIYNSDEKIKINNNRITKILLFTKPNKIEKLYDTGFVSMWASNHWLLMWFYKNYPDYDFYWSIEYDVRIIGNMDKLWKINKKYDFVYPVKPFTNESDSWLDTYVGDIFTLKDFRFGYLQLARYSNRFLYLLDLYFINGEHAQDELITYTIFNNAKKKYDFRGTHIYLAKHIKNSWSVDGNYSEKNHEIIKNHNGKRLLLLHPVK